MKPALCYRSVLFFLIVIFLLSFFVVPDVSADDPKQPDEDSVTITDDAITYTADLERSGKYDTFAGGSACCNCDVKHYGKIPSGFPKSEIVAVSFYASTSRKNSYYNKIEVGPTQLKLKLGDRESIAWSGTVTQEMSVPEGANWHVTFRFAPL